MRRPLIRRTIRSLLALATVGGALAVTTPAEAGIQAVAVTGTATCDTAGPVGRYQLNWTFTNAYLVRIDIEGAIETGAFNGNVLFSPNPVQAGSNATGSDGPVPGTTAGTVTLTVSYRPFEASSPSVAVGTITLDGRCAVPATTTPPTSAARTVTTRATTTTATPARVAPRFTG